MYDYSNLAFPVSSVPPIVQMQQNRLNKFNLPASDTDGDLGPVYGKQWRSWAAPDGRVIDQITDAVQQLKTNPQIP